MRISDWISDVCSSDLQTDVAEASPESAPPPPAFAAATEPAPRVAPAAADAPLPFRRPRRNPAKRWTAIAASAAVLMIAATAGLAYFGLPGWAQGLGLPGGVDEPDRVIELPPNEDPRELADGTNYLAAAGVSRMQEQKSELQPLMRNP